MYKIPDSDLGVQKPDCSCPNCNYQISLWHMARPTGFPNRFKCKHCGTKSKFDYTSAVYILILSLEGIVGGLSGIISMLIAISLFGMEDSTALFTNAFIIFFILGGFLYVSFRLLIAVISRNKYKIVERI